MAEPADMDPARWIEAWGLADQRPIARSPRAKVFGVTCADGRPAALKLLTAEGMGSEGDQGWFLRHWDGCGMVRCLNAKANAILMEWLPGPDLVDMARGGSDDDAARLIAETALRLAGVAPPRDCRGLADRCGALRAFDGAGLPAGRRALMAKGRDLAEGLLADAPDPALLHGDLHHENVRRAQRGWLAFDPKGICGDPHHDLANAFRNPGGAPELTTVPARIRRRADIFAEVTGLDRSRLMDWAAAKAALSIAWFSAAGAVPEDEWGILAALLAARQ